jgi:GT2 family glycosyltransferase
LQGDALRRLAAFLDQHPTCGVVGPSLTYPDGRLQPSAKRFPALGFAVGEVLWWYSLFPGNRAVRRFYYADRDLTEQPWVDMVSGAAMLIRAPAFRRVGGFDEGFRLYFEETDLCWRLRRAGFSVALCPDAKAVHWHGASTIQTTVRQVDYYLSYIRFFRKHQGAWTARLFTVAVALGALVRMGGVLFKYPPLTRQNATLLPPKMAACLRLLGSLWRSTGDYAPVEVQL